MKIGILYSGFRKDMHTAIMLAGKMGAIGVQLSFKELLAVEKINDRAIATVKSWLNTADVEISAFCADMGGPGFCDAKLNPERVAKTKIMIDTAQKFGVRVLTSHVGIIPADPQKETYKALKSALTEIGKYAAERGITYAIETGPEIATTLKAFIDGMEGIGVNLDPANFVMVTGQDPAAAVRLLGKAIVHTHAKDGVNLRKCSSAEVYGSLEPGEMHKTSSSKPVFRETPLGEGSVNWDEYLAALKEVGYDGYFAIERETRRRPYKTIKQAYDFLVKKLHKDRTIVMAVVGCGNIARGAHCANYSKIPNYKLKYCVDIVKERAQAFANAFGVKGYTKVATDYREALADPEVEAVDVCTHTNMHAQIAIEAMQAGKHVLSEKPMAMSAELAHKMVETANATGKISNVAVCMRYDGAVNAIKELIMRGELGEIYNVYCSFRQFRNIPGIGGEFTDKSHSGGGVLFDWGVHLLDLVMYCIGSPAVKSASAATYSELGKDIEHYHTKGVTYSRGKQLDGVYDVEEYVTGLVKLQNGASITLNGAWAQNIDEREMFIDFMGTKAGVRMTYGGKFTLYTEKNGKFIKLKPKFKPCDIYLEEQIAFAKDVLNDRRSRQFAPNIVNTAELLDALYKSAE